MTYPEAVKFLYSLGNEVAAMKLGLEPITRLMAALGDPQRSYQVVHVAGTNGKGSVCAMIEAALRASGIRTGLFTSPHLAEPTERIQVGGLDVSQAEFARACDTVRSAAATLDLDAHPTYFEFVTAMALWLFREKKIATAVVEVGLGGRLDSTNIVQPTLTIITPIDYDHAEFLGDTLTDIALEKAGILKPGVPVVLAPQPPEAEAAILARAAEVGAPVIQARDYQVHDLVKDSRGCEFSGIRCPLAGDHQVTNAVTAVVALQHLGIDPCGIRDTVWPGRLEVVAPNPDVILDGAHNPGGAAALAHYLKQYYSGRRIWLIFGVMADKSYAEMADALFPLAHRRIYTAPANSRALPPAMLLAFGDGHITDNITQAVDYVNQEITATGLPTDGDAIVIAGSLYLVGEARKLYLHPTGGRW